MGKSLVIVESPAKAKTINKYLGSDFVVKSSVGHIRDLPTSGSASTSDPKERARLAAESRKLPPAEREARKQARKQQQLFDRMGIYPEQQWRANYQLLTGKEKVVEELKRYAKTADTIYLATDLDREGEAIAWHLTQILGGDASKYKRVIFNQITKTAIQEAFAKPTELDVNMVNAQQARRFLDRLVGYMVSPLLWEKVARGLSAGRVQSVAVRLIVEREQEIRAFIPEEFWTLAADTSCEQGRVLFDAVRHRNEAYRPVSKAQSDHCLDELQRLPFVVTDREDKPTSSKPAAPFITSTLQQAASTRLSFSVKKTMTLAQRLYEAGYITYMRTDSTNLSPEAVSMARDYLTRQFGDQYLPDSPNVYGAKKNAQEAHEAIRPTDIDVTLDKLDAEPDAKRLYDLIWRRFLASQATEARYLSTSLEVASGDYVLRARGRIQLFPGHTAILSSGAKDEPSLPDIQVGQALTVLDWLAKQNFTKPPARFSEAALVKELEKRGIGRPSTYSSIISTIQDRGYVHTEARKFFAEKIGDIVTDRLVANFANLLDYDFTAQMEMLLDEVADGQREWRSVLDDFYLGFQQQLRLAEENMRANEPTMTDVECGSCGRQMMIRTGSTGVFLGCSGYSLPPSERCKTTMDLMPADDVVDADNDDLEAEAFRKKKRCSKCGTAMDEYLLDASRKLHICGNNPDCDGYLVEQGQFKLKGYEGPTIECDKCTSPMELKNGRFGKYFDCTNGDCKNTRKVLKSGQPAPPKMDPIAMPNLACQKVDDHYVLRDGAAGLFLAASKFPKNRETRAPLVKELLPVRSQLEEKYHYLLTGPERDSQGNDCVIRFSRKTQSSYLMTENEEGKATGWSAVFEEGQWQIKQKGAK